MVLATPHLLAGQVADIGAGNTVSDPTLSGGTLQLQSGASVTGDISFTGTGGTLIIEPNSDGTTTVPTNEIDGFAAGDTIKLAGIPLTSTGGTYGTAGEDTYTVATAGTLTIDADGTVYELLVADARIGQHDFAINGDLGVTEVTCYVAGTRIATIAGEVAVEALKTGDRVLTMSGSSRPVRWIGYRHLDLTRHPVPDRVRPIRIRASAFADSVPRRDLFLSPDHAVLRDGVLIPARLLVNGASIVRDAVCRVVTYYHVELDAHDILLAENLPAESYLDTGNRGLFLNGGEPLLLHPDLTHGQARREAESCAPFVADPERVEPAWRALAARAVQLGWQLPPEPSTTDDPALALLVDGRRVAPVSVAHGHYAFLLPGESTTVRLVSRSAVANETRPWVSDDRRLGILLRKLTVRSCRSVVPIPLDHPALGDGWWQPEWHSPTTLRRWTNGDGLVPMPDIRLMEPGQRLLEVEVAATLAYPLPATGGVKDARAVYGLTPTVGARDHRGSCSRTTRLPATCPGWSEAAVECQLQSIDADRRDDLNGEGFRMPSGVRKPPMHEPAELR